MHDFTYMKYKKKIHRGRVYKRISVAEGKEDEELLLDGYDVSVWSDENVLEIHSDYTIL